MSDGLSKRRLKLWIRLLGVTRAAEAELRDFLRSVQATAACRLSGGAALSGVHLHHRLSNDLDLFYGTPSEANEKAKVLYAANRFSVTRQLRYSRDETQLALDLGLFINGLPIATFERPEA